MNLTQIKNSPQYDGMFAGYEAIFCPACGAIMSIRRMLQHINLNADNWCSCGYDRDRVNDCLGYTDEELEYVDQGCFLQNRFLGLTNLIVCE